MHNPKPVLDGKQVEELRNVDGGRGAVLARLVAKFKASVPQRVAHMHGHLESAALDELAATAHSLKGAAASLGAARFAALCGAIEQAAQAQDAPSARAMMAQLDAETEAACAALQNIVGHAP